MHSYLFQTFGCQMNVADSDEIERELQARGFTKCETPGAADLIIVNTCSVRAHAEQRALARIAEFAAIAAKRRNASLWVIGCMAERLGESLKTMIPGVKQVIGSRKLDTIGPLLDTLAAATSTGHLPDNAADLFEMSSVSDFVPVMRGCNNYCAYCIVPFVRGPEQSIPAETIINEVQRRICAGVKEIVLLGQNVDSYNDHGIDFPELLLRVASLDNVQRVRFTTSHPKDFSERLVKAMASHPAVCHHVHLPVQSGSDTVLARMNRHYSSSHYIELIDMVRRYLPDADITTDLLVGFPSETDEDYAKTRELVARARFTTAFMFAYSVRDGTAAAQLTDDIPRKVKLERLSSLIALQTAITGEIYQSAIGRGLDVLITGRQEKRDRMWMGQDNGCKRVLVKGDTIQAGTILRVNVQRSSGMTLVAERI